MYSREENKSKEDTYDTASSGIPLTTQIFINLNLLPPLETRIRVMNLSVWNILRTTLQEWDRY